MNCNTTHYRANSSSVPGDPTLTFGLIFQQVVFPSLARSWRLNPEAGRRALDGLVRVLVAAFVPIAVGTTALAGPLVHALFRAEYEGSAVLLAIGAWRAPLLILAFLYQSSLIALNREAAGVRLLLLGAIGSAPTVAALRWTFGLPGAVAGVLAIGLALVVTGHRRLAAEGRQPAWHHHLARPLVASLVMVPASLFLVRWGLAAAIAGGAATYLAALSAVGGVRREDFRVVFSRTMRSAATGGLP